MTARDKVRFITTRKLLVFLVKVCMAVMMFGWLIRQHRLDASRFAYLRADLPYFGLLLLAAAFILVGLLLMSWRFQLLLQHLCFAIRYREVLGLTFIGSFFGAVLPGLIGGDVVKAVYLCGRVSARRAEAVAAVFVDRLIGLYTLVLLSVAVLLVAVACDCVRINRQLLLIIPCIWIAFTGCLGLLGWSRWYRSRLHQTMVSRLPLAMQNGISAIHLCCRSPRLVVFTVGLSALNHLLVVLSFWLAGIMLQDSLSVSDHLLLDPLAMLMNIIPLTPGGIGMAEAAFSLLFEQAASANGAVIGLFGRLLQYAVFAVGGTLAFVLLRVRHRYEAEDAQLPQRDRLGDPTSRYRR